MKELDEKYNGISIPQEDSIEAYYKIRQQLEKLAKELQAIFIKPRYCLPFMQPGRLVKVHLPSCLPHQPFHSPFPRFNCFCKTKQNLHWWLVNSVECQRTVESQIWYLFYRTRNVERNVAVHDGPMSRTFLSHMRVLSSALMSIRWHPAFGKLNLDM